MPEKPRCTELESWKAGIDAGNLYIVYSSAYPNNPASLFGHTFLRFDKRGGEAKSPSQKLLGYSLAFQAAVNPNDSALTYTYKGLMGEYPGYLELNPYYINVGIYNNFESRDLWEYQIPLSKEEKLFFTSSCLGNYSNHHF